jgi:hypothetical protein
MMRTGIPCSGSDLRNSAQICIDDWGSATSYPDEVIDFHPARSLSVTSSFALHGQSMDVVVVFIAPGLTARCRWGMMTTCMILANSCKRPKTSCGATQNSLLLQLAGDDQLQRVEIWSKRASLGSISCQAQNALLSCSLSPL